MKTLNPAIAEQYNHTLTHIRQLVETSTLPRKAIADSVGLSAARMRRKLAGETVLTVNDVCAFAYVFKVDPAELV
ncbi:hypothetical protein [Arthrobacter antibioticus]|uniref:hypothetical protein n=1 Tax=Arthrobacter sp. H35-MC1 TaxID=3046203 RepID=UPI0024BBA022|nr:hypothetical protein [Arthrobacter sp. H35-MC1]MDJ0317862.1 hypothetical protein [Arthrobacter sp. H35-MC1]